MVEGLTIFSNDIWVKAVLPFLLVFTLIFAVLEKSKVLGEGKRQINALVALSVGLIVILFGYAIYIITNMIAFLAIGLVIIVVFMILVGVTFEPGQFKLHDNVKWAFMGVISLAVVVAALYFTGAWGWLYDKATGAGGASSLITNSIFIVVIIAVVLAVVLGGKEKSSSGEKKN